MPKVCASNKFIIIAFNIVDFPPAFGPEIIAFECVFPISILFVTTVCGSINGVQKSCK